MKYKNTTTGPANLQAGQPLRLPTHNYGWTGTYFVTVHAEEARQPFTDPALLRILQETWLALQQPFPDLILDAFVILPAHVHFIVSLDGNSNRATTLGRVVEAYKSLTAVAWLRHIETAGLECPGRIWQRTYHERLVHDGLELEQIRQYIRNKVQS